MGLGQGQKNKQLEGEGRQGTRGCWLGPCRDTVNGRYGRGEDTVSRDHRKKEQSQENHTGLGRP